MKRIKELSSNRAITLIALIITIIVMLILVAVSIQIALNTGLFDSAGKVTQDWRTAQDKEQQIGEGQVKIGDKTYGSIEDYMMGNFQWEEILADANVNPEKYKHEEQLVSDYIAIGTDGESVNMDLWNPTLLEDGTFDLKTSVNMYGFVSGYAYSGNINNGEIQGKVPQYIYNEETNKFEPVTKMSSTFYGYSELKNIIIPSSVTSLDGTFVRCVGLTYIEIPSSVRNIGSSTFSGCSELININVDLENEVYDSRENCNAIIETSTNTLIKGCSNTVIPSSVTSIGNTAFSGCSSLTDISIPSSVTSIGSTAFYGCSSLTDISIPSSVKSIGNSAFYGCSSLTEVSIPSGVERIGTTAFAYCPAITIITIPATVTDIGSYAFNASLSMCIYCEVTSKPSGWNSAWCGSESVNIFWGSTGPEDTE